SRTLVHATAQFFEIQHDRFVRAEQVGQDLVARTNVARALLLAAEEGPQALTQVLRQHAFEILQRGSAQLGVVGVKPAIGDLQWRRRQHERQQREDVRETLPRTILQELV